MHRLSTSTRNPVHERTGTRRHDARHRLGGPGPVPTTESGGRRRRSRWIVVVARPVGDSELVGALCTLDAITGGRFHVLVAPTPDIIGATAFVLASGGCVPVDPLTLTGGAVPRNGRARLDTILAGLHRAGLDATGDVSHGGTIGGVGDALRNGSFDGIAVLARPRPVLRGLGLELPQRLARRFGLPVHRLGAAGG
ncbi:MAG: hypothetical protein FJW83_09025 [Actinobacteria bacterium]|nr:hypothetical protein [Actinomycetota bacterium]